MNFQQYNIKIKAELSELNPLRERIEKILSFVDILELNRIVLAVDEIVSNIIEHGYKFNSKEVIEINITINNEHDLLIEILDNAPYFKPDIQSRVNLESYPEEGKHRGLGLILVQYITDEFNYYPREPVGNQYILKKYLNAHR